MMYLPKNLKKNGFDYTQVLRTDKVCLYRQDYENNWKYYDVFIVEVRPPLNHKGHDPHAYEVFPSNEDFGRTAWSCRTMLAAINKLIELNFYS